MQRLHGAHAASGHQAGEAELIHREVGVVHVKREGAATTLRHQRPAIHAVAGGNLDNNEL